MKSKIFLRLLIKRNSFTHTNRTKMKTTIKTVIEAILDLIKTVVSSLTYQFEQWFWKNEIKPKEIKHFADGFHEGRWEDDKPIENKNKDEEILGI